VVNQALGSASFPKVHRGIDRAKKASLDTETFLRLQMNPFEICSLSAALLRKRAGENPSRLRPGSGFGFGLGAFLTSFLPLSLFPCVQA